MARVSVVVPVYGVEAYVADAVASVLAQTYEDFELLLVDDASPDGSVAACRRFSDPRIRIIRQEHRGLAGARNTGIRQARGEYIALLDGDDLWRPDKLEKHVRHLDGAPAVGVSFSHWLLIDEAGRVIREARPSPEEVTPAHLLRANALGNGSTPVVRREVFEAIKLPVAAAASPSGHAYFDEDFREAQGCEDLECWLRIAIQTPWRFEVLPEPLTLYRISATALSSDPLSMMASWEMMLGKTRRYAPSLVARHERPARALMLRYLAGRALRLRDGEMALRFMRRALFTHSRLLVDQPYLTLRQSVAACLLRLLPLPLYERLEAAGLKLQHALLAQAHREAPAVQKPLC